MSVSDEQMWLERVRACVLRGDMAGAENVLDTALAGNPRSFELRRARAGVFQQTGRAALAEPLLRELLTEHPDDFASAFSLARLLIAQARGRAAAQTLQDCFAHGEHNVELAIKAIELLDEADRKEAAADIAALALKDAPQDARLHAYAGMLQLQLGHFAQGREHYLSALEQDVAALEWHAPLGLANAQRYQNSSHPDFALFDAYLQRDDLGDKGRSTLLFALGKAHDDIGDYALAADYFRRANALARSLTRWSRKDWRRAVEARLAAQPIAARLEPDESFIPIFIVGMPRTGTTLLAELLSRYRQVCNRGELPWVAKLAQMPELSGDPSHAALARAAAVYRARSMQDDADGARWFIDKQPLNFRYIDLMLAMFPHAKVIHCQRDPRATALSLWMQSFNEDVQGYAYDFGDIQTVMRDADRLAAHWASRYPNSVSVVRYEEVVAHPSRAIAPLATWIGLSGEPARSATATTISTASLWQARQPMYSSSIDHWRNYLPYVPALRELA